MQTFYLKLNAPRPTFTMDMTPEERELMGAHALYWREWMAKGHIVAFGLVADPAGAFGMGIAEFQNEADARVFADGDPTIKANRGFSIDMLAMPFGAVRP